MHTRLTKIGAVVAYLVAALAVVAAPATAAPGDGSLTAGTCQLVNLRFYTVETQTETTLKIRADAGATCVEADNNSGFFHRTGGLFLDGPVVSCEGAASMVEANVTFVPAGRSFDPYTSLRLTLISSGGPNGVALILKSGDLPPHFVGSGALLAGEGNTCSAATWAKGSINYEDPQARSPI